MDLRSARQQHQPQAKPITRLGKHFGTYFIELMPSINGEKPKERVNYLDKDGNIIRQELQEWIPTQQDFEATDWEESK